MCKVFDFSGLYDKPDKPRTFFFFKTTFVQTYKLYDITLTKEELHRKCFGSLSATIDNQQATEVLKNHRVLSIDVDSVPELFDVNLNIPKTELPLVDHLESYAQNRLEPVLLKIDRILETSPLKPTKFVHDRPGWFQYTSNDKPIKVKDFELHFVAFRLLCTKL